jgi:hypothetical protein
MHHSSQDFDERDAIRATAAKNPEWRKFIELSRPHVQYQVSAELSIVMMTSCLIQSMSR